VIDLSRELKETEQTLSNISELLYQAAKPAETFRMKFVNAAAESQKMGVIMRFLSGSGAWQFLNKVRALAIMVQGYSKSLDEANQALRDGAKNYAEQIGHMRGIEGLFNRHGEILDENRLKQSDMFIGLQEMYGEEYAMLKIREMSVHALEEQGKKMKQIADANMTNKDILSAMEYASDDKFAELAEIAQERGLGKLNEEGQFEPFTGFKLFFKKRMSLISKVTKSVGTFVKGIGKAALAFVKAGAKIFMMSLLYIGMFLFLLILAKPFILRMMDAAKDIQKRGSETMKFLGIFFENFKERFAVVWKMASNFVKVLFDKEKGFKETLAAYFQLVFAVLKLVVGTLWDLIPVVGAFLLETIFGVLLPGLITLVFDGIAFLIRSAVAGWRDIVVPFLMKQVARLGNFFMGSKKRISGAVIGGAIGAPLGPVGMIVGASVGAAIAGQMATGGIAGLSGKYLVGERGPEIVELPRGAKVTPNHQIRNTGGNTIHVHVSGRVGASDQEIRDIARKVGAQVSREINRTTSSGMRA
jgi:hypothetical protein